MLFNAFRSGHVNDVEHFFHMDVDSVSLDPIISHLSVGRNTPEAAFPDTFPADSSITLA